MERRKILMFFTALMVLLFFLLYVVILQLPEPSVATNAALLITVFLCVYFGFRMAFADKATKNWKKALLVVGLIYGSVVFSSLGFGETVETGYFGLFNSPFIAADFLFAISAILGLAAILAVILILDKYIAEADIKAETDRHRLPKEDNP